MRLRRTALAVPALGVAAAAGILAAPTAQGASGGPTFHAPTRADDPAISGTGMYASEPATIVGGDGTRYVANQLGSQLSYTRDGGRTWAHPGGQDILSKNVSGCTSLSDVGDVDLTADTVGQVFFADLQIAAGAPTDNGIQPIIARSTDRFAHYQGTCAAHQVASVDREWMAAYTPPGAGPGSSRVYLSYHDFGPNFISVNHSYDGGVTWSAPVPVVDNPQAVDASGCDTVPAGTAVDPRNGWVYVAWTSGDNPASNAATGCNYTQGTVFNKLWVAVSKDGGQTFTTSLATAGASATAAAPDDMSEIFGSIAVDRAGGVYVAFPAFLDKKYDVYTAYSPPADSAGALHFRAPRQISHLPIGTAYFPRIVAGSKGRVDLIFLGTSVRNVQATPANKVTYNGSDPTKPNCTPEATDPGGKGVRFFGKPCELPASAQWYLYLAQSLNAASTSPTYTVHKLRPDPVHTGDICTLGIFCLSDDNRDLADTNDVKIDKTGGAQIAYTYENPRGTRTEIDFQCQAGGPGLYAGVAVRDCRS